MLLFLCFFSILTLTLTRPPDIEPLNDREIAELDRHHLSKFLLHPPDDPYQLQEQESSHNGKQNHHSWRVVDGDSEPKPLPDYEYYFQTNQRRRRRPTTTTTPAPYTYPTPPPPPPPPYNPYTTTTPPPPYNPYTTTTPPPPLPSDIIASVRLVKAGNPAVDQTVRRHGEIHVRYNSEPVIVIPAPPPPYTTPAPPPPVYAPPPPPPPVYPTAPPPPLYPTAPPPPPPYTPPPPPPRYTTTPVPYPSPEAIWRQVYPQMVVVQYPTTTTPPPPPVYTTTTTTPPPPPFYLDDDDSLPPPSRSPKVIYAIMMMDKSGRVRLARRRGWKGGGWASSATASHPQVHSWMTQVRKINEANKLLS